MADKVVVSKKEAVVESNRSIYIISSCLLVIFVAIASFTIGFVTGRWSKSDGAICQALEKTKNMVFTGDLYPPSEVEEVDFDLYWEVLQMLENTYVDPSAIDKQKIVYYSIKGMVSSLGDMHTVFFDPEETKQYEESNKGSLEGIGAQIGYQGNNIIIVAPLEGSPAQKAGLQSGDIITAVDGEKISGKSIYEVVAMIRGEAGTTVTLTIWRLGQDEPFDVDIVRAKIEVPAIDYEYDSDSNIATISIYRFTEESVTAWNKEWDSIVEKVENDKPKSIIIDLRGNPGGYLDSAIYALEDFISMGKTLLKGEGRGGKIEALYTVSREGRLLGTPIVILVNVGSASAAEIFAGVMQEYNRATIIGTDTYGKGTVQRVLDFSDGSSLHVTIQKWVLPSGKNITQDDPIKPDIEVKISDEEYKQGLDPQMDRAKEEAEKL